MAPRLRIPVRIDPAFRRSVSSRELTQTARLVLASENVVGPAELSVYVTDDATVQRLNREFLGLDEPTDVLSFPLAGVESIPPDEPALLGEVVISYPTAERQAQEQHHSARDELAHLLVHGVLHILGYDHLEPDDERRMRAREVELLGADPHHA